MTGTINVPGVTGANVSSAVQVAVVAQNTANKALAANASAYSNTATYAVGDFCIYDNTLYRCSTAIETAEAWDATHWTATTTTGEIKTVKATADQAAAGVSVATSAQTTANKALAAQATAYDSAATYAVGDYCIYDNALYRCTTAIPLAEEWDLTHWTATTIAQELAAVRSTADQAATGVGQITASGAKHFYATFDTYDWSTELNANGYYEVRFPKSQHGLTPTCPDLSYDLKFRAWRSAIEMRTDADATTVRGLIKAAIQAAIEAGSDSYPVDGTYGYPILSWEQLQYYILDEVLAVDETAKAKATERGFDWQDIDTTGAVSTNTLTEILSSGYTAALGGSSSLFESQTTLTNLQGLRFRIRDSAYEPNTVTKYDRFGYMMDAVWCVIESFAYFDMSNQDIVIVYEGSSESAFNGYAGSILVDA